MFHTILQAGVPHVSNRTIRRSLRAKGFKFRQCGKKGQLSVEDLKKRFQFARRCVRQPDEVWARGIPFYLDGNKSVNLSKLMNLGQELPTKISHENMGIKV